MDLAAVAALAPHLPPVPAKIAPSLMPPVMPLAARAAAATMLAASTLLMSTTSCAITYRDWFAAGAEGYCAVAELTILAGRHGR